eukprot:scaffold32923_cov79-Isochrysis_galbana.AAC.1
MGEALDAHAQRRRERDELIQRLLEERRRERERAATAPVSQAPGAAAAIPAVERSARVAWREPASKAVAGPAANGSEAGLPPRLDPGPKPELRVAESPPAAEPSRSGPPASPGAQLAPKPAGDGEGARRLGHEEPVGPVSSAHAQRSARRPAAQIRRDRAAVGGGGGCSGTGTGGGGGNDSGSHSSGYGCGGGGRCCNGCGSGSGNSPAGAGAESSPFTPRINARSRTIASSRVGSATHASD